MNKTKTLQILNIIGYLIMLGINFLAVLLPLNGKTTGELADAYPNLFVPEGFTFSIWSVIYITLLIFVIFQAKGLFSNNASKQVERTGWSFFISCILNAAWIVAWHYQLVGISVIIMFSLLILLIKIYSDLFIGVPVKLKTKLVYQLPFSIYLGWISVASIANTTALLVNNNFNGLGMSEVLWTVIMMVIGAILALLFLYRKNDYAYAAVFIWAFYGIYCKRISTTPLISEVSNTAMILLGLLTISILFVIVRNRRITNTLT